jgi:hypothetical protein
MGLEFNLAALKTGSTISMGRPGSMSQASTPTLGATREGPRVPDQLTTSPSGPHQGLEVLQTVQEVSTPNGQATAAPQHPQASSVAGSELHRDSGGVSTSSTAELSPAAGKHSRKFEKLLKMFNKH